MAITVNNTQTNINNSLSYTPSSVTDAVLVVVVGNEDNATGDVTVDFGATAMTEAIQVEVGPNFTLYNKSAIFYLIDPGTSAETISATLTGTTSPVRVALTAFTLGGIAQTSPVDATASTTSESAATSLDTDITTVEDSTVIVGAIAGNSTETFTAQGTQTLQSSLTPTSSNSGSSTQIQATAGLENQGFNFASQSVDVLVLASFKEASAAPSGDTSTVLMPIPPTGFDATNPAGLEYTNNLPKLLFDATTSELVYWVFRLPENYSSSPVLHVQYTAASATSGTFSIDVSVMAVSDGDAQDVDTESYDTANTPTAVTVPATAGYLDEISATLTNNDSMSANDLVFIKLARNIADTATGDIEVRAVSLEYTGA